VADVPKDDPEVYRMLARADSVGVFQVESRAQMSMLPRLKPTCFYDLVIEVAIVRPGPIQGDMVHPYLRRRDGVEPVEFPAPAPEHGPPDELARVLGKTLGVPLFQEQAMRLAIEAAKFTPDEANGLRRAMATFRNNGTVGVYRDKFIRGMTDRGYDPAFAERCFRQIEGFGSYGFPESHAASFAKLVYASAWLKRWRPDVFLAAILNSQPMGFYQPAQLVRDAREHGVDVREVDAFLSDWDTQLEGNGPAAPFKPVRLGLSQVRGLAEADARRVIAARATGAKTLQGLLEAGAPRAALERLAEADAFRSVGLDRRAGLWAARGLDLKAATPETAPLLALMGARAEPDAALPPEALSEQTVEDYRMVGLSLKAHPVAFFREALSRRGVLTAAELRDPGLKSGRRVKTAGIVLIRQRPGTAKGVTFLTLEDETGAANLIVWRDRFQANRKVVMTAAFLLAEGVHQREGDVIHLIADRFVDLSHRLSVLRDPDAARLAPEVRAAEAGRMTRPRSFR
jgi:error-prone DNA polymerase